MSVNQKAFDIFNKLETGQRVYDMDDDFIELADEVTRVGISSIQLFDNMNKFFKDNYIDLTINSYLNIVKQTSYLEFTLISRG